MNLVVDDAVEVKLATKSEEEKRRPLGMKTCTDACAILILTPFRYRSNTAQGRQRFPHPSRPVIANHSHLLFNTSLIPKSSSPFSVLRTRIYDSRLHEAVEDRVAIDKSADMWKLYCFGLEITVGAGDTGRHQL